mmetsp:Transcript_9737/g.21029  ORF Transcript_9737/g.21029 Transcript_9737/m.21029 type:complete len:218 (+) Transcript_9737:134-787(+)
MDLRIGAVSCSVQTDWCFGFKKVSKPSSWVFFRVREPRSINSLIRCGVPTATPNSVFSSCLACSPMVPCLGKSFATRSFIGARSFRTATLRRAERQKIKARGLRCCVLFLSCFLEMRHMSRSIKLLLSMLLSMSYLFLLFSLAMCEDWKLAPENRESISALDSADSNRIFDPRTSIGPPRFFDFRCVGSAVLSLFEVATLFSSLSPPSPRRRFWSCC